MSYPPVPPLQAWWVQMTVCAAFNVVLFAVVWRRTRAYVVSDYALKHAWSARYCRAMRLLAIPYVFECAWRSLLPSQYNTRIVIVDNSVNDVLAARLLAAVGETCWAIQWSWALRVIAVNSPLVPGALAHSVVRRGVPVLTYVTASLGGIAQLFSIAGMVSTNYYWNVWEESLWACVFILVTLGAGTTWVLGADAPGYVLVNACVRPADDDQVALLKREHHHTDVSIWVTRVFLRLLCMFGLACSVYTCAHDVPYWMQLYRNDEAAGKTYFDLADGFRDAASVWHVNQTLDAWSDQFLWMSGYFFFGPLSAIVLMFAPGRVRFESCDCPLHEHGLVVA